MIRATFAGFDTALSALRMNQKKLDIVGHNLANMNTEGYTRQELRTSSINYDNPTSFYMNQNDVNVGFGVAMDEVRQLRDQFLDKQYRIQNSRSSYNLTINDSLKSLSSFMDESKAKGIRSALDDIQTSLTNMQDPSKVQDPVYEGELMSRVQAFTTLLNSAAENIKTARANEFQKLNGVGTSENGAVQKINSLLDTIGQLNVEIKRNQLLGNPALELQDKRNLALDELASYIPIEVERFSEEYTAQKVDKNTGKPIAGETETRYRIYNYDERGNIVGRSNWPEDLRVSLKYTENDGNKASSKSLVLVNGAIDGLKKEKDGTAYNVGRVSLATRTKEGSLPDENDPTNTQLQFQTYHTRDAAGRDAAKITTDTGASNDSRKSIRFQGGSVQASLDMLSSSDYDKLITQNGTKITDLGLLKASSEMNSYSYDYYMDRLDALAQKFSRDMNRLNLQGNTSDAQFRDAVQKLKDQNAASTSPIPNYKPTNEEVYAYLEKQGTVKNHILLIDKTKTSTDSAAGITASNIGIAKGWVNGTTHIGTTGFLSRSSENTASTHQGDFTDTVTEMLRTMISPQMRQNNTRTSYSDYMNNISTVLATDAYANNNSYTINKTVLDSLGTSRDQLSGVSLDEEAANMMTYTSSYNAAARLMTALDETLKSLLNIGA